MRIHSSSLSLQASNNSRPTAKNSGAQNFDLPEESSAQNQQPNLKPSSPDEIKKILSTVVTQLNASVSNGLDTRTSKALLAYRLESNSPVTTQSLSEITGIDVYA